MKIVWLKPRSGYVTDLRSVTLWGSICWSIRYLAEDKQFHEFMDNCKAGKPDFVISSVFPWKGRKGNRILFFPNPLLHSDNFERADKYLEDALVRHEMPRTMDDVERALIIYRQRKKLKDIKFLNQSDFEQMLQGNLTADDLLERLIEEYVLQKVHKKKLERKLVKGDYFPQKETIERTPPVRYDYSMTHNTIDRLRGGTLSIREEGEDKKSGQLFHANDTWWSDPYDETESGETGLFFLVQELTKDSVENYLQPALRLLEHWGIGADRTVGKGFFEFEVKEFNLQQPAANDANAVLTLSLFIPENKEQLSFIEKSNRNHFYPYTLESRESKGWTEQGGFEKDPVLFFTEGSLFERLPGMNTNWAGRIRENKNIGHPVYDNGFGFMVNLKWNVK
jgi:CRISPR-associated protein Csm4